MWCVIAGYSGLYVFLLRGGWAFPDNNANHWYPVFAGSARVRVLIFSWGIPVCVVVLICIVFNVYLLRNSRHLGLEGVEFAVGFSCGWRGSNHEQISCGL